MQNDLDEIGIRETIYHDSQARTEDLKDLK